MLGVDKKQVIIKNGGYFDSLLFVQPSEPSNEQEFDNNKMHRAPNTTDIQSDGTVTSKFTICVPKIQDIIRCFDSDSDFVVLCCAGKATSSNKYWLSLSSVKTLSHHTRIAFVAFF